MKLAEIAGFDGQRTGEISTSVEGRQRKGRKLSQAIAAAMESILQQRANHTLFPLKRIFFVLQPASEAAAANRGYLSMFV